MVLGSGFVRVLGSGFWVLGAGCWVLGSGFGMTDACSQDVVARTYRELVCWQLSTDLKKGVYALIAKPTVMKDVEFCHQIRGAARGAPRTIAEGFGRFRPADFARYLEFARASLIETQNHLDDALDCQYATDKEHAALMKLANKAIGATTNLHRYLQAQRSNRSSGP
jgi:four helix bundle protein